MQAAHYSKDRAERFCRDIPKHRLRGGMFTSVPALEVAINGCVAHHNARPEPFIWTAPAKSILAKLTRAKSALAHASR